MKKYIFILLALFISTEAMAKWGSHSRSYRSYRSHSFSHHKPVRRLSNSGYHKYTPTPAHKAPKTVVVQQHVRTNTIVRESTQSFSQRHPMLSGVVGGMAGSWLYNSVFGDGPAQQQEEELEE